MTEAKSGAQSDRVSSQFLAKMAVSVRPFSDGRTPGQSDAAHQHFAGNFSTDEHISLELSLDFTRDFMVLSNSQKARLMRASSICSAVLYLFMSGIRVAYASDPDLDLTAALGSKPNPVRAQMPAGEREYLMRLRCADGKAPKFDRGGSVGRGPYGNILDAYNVECDGSKSSVVMMDMYHRDYREMTAVPGFTLLPELPARIARGCPPLVPGTSEGKYVFNALELEWPTRMQQDALKLKPVGVQGRAFVRLIVTDEGRADAASVEILSLSTEQLRQHTLNVIGGLIFQPPEHHPGCKVPQSIEFPIEFP